MVINKVKKILAAQLDIDVNKITESTDIAEDLGADVLDQLGIGAGPDRPAPHRDG